MPRHCLILAGLILSFFGAAPAHAAPAFVPTACDGPGITPDLAPRLQCGTVAVPADPDQPIGPQFRLAVVVIHPAGGARADPVVYIAGGPGSPLTTRAAEIAQHEAAILAPERDLVLVDQRGIGRSEPSLCPGLARQQLAIFAAGADLAELVDRWRNSYDTCRAEMAAAGLSPAWFGTTITANDFATIRAALGYDRWTVYAISYGTTVAMTMLAQSPTSLDAVVLDSVFPPDPLPISAADSFGNARSALFAACQADPGCAARYPTLDRAYDDAVRSFDAAPLIVDLPSGGQFALRGETFRLIVDRSLYSRAGQAGLPAFIDAARRRDPLPLRPILTAITRGYASLSLGAMAAVECRDRPSWRDDAAPGDAPVDAFVPGMCRSWPPLGPPPLLPENTSVPVLILAGADDPITPPAFARHVAAALGPRARLIEFAHVGHGAEPATPCGGRIVSAFIRHPAETLDASCATRIPPVDFH